MVLEIILWIIRFFFGAGIFSFLHIVIDKLKMCIRDSLNAVRSTSAGRLFDGVSAILGIRKKSTFEGEASTALEFAAEAYEKTMQHPYKPLMLKPFTETAEDLSLIHI